MVVCVCNNYRTKDLENDVNTGKSLRDIIHERGIGTGCKTCCAYIKEEYANLTKEK